MKSKNLVIALAAGVALAAGMLLAMRTSLPAVPAHATLYPEPAALADFSLVDQNDTPFTPASFAGQWDMVFFGFTSCPDICPATLQKLSMAKQTIQDAGADELPRIVLVSVDPERDTPEQMGRYVDYFGDGNIGVTGSLEGIAAFAKSIGIYFAKVDLENGDYTMDHSAAVLVINPNAEITAVFGGSYGAEEYASDMQIIIGNN